MPDQTEPDAAARTTPDLHRILMPDVDWLRRAIPSLRQDDDAAVLAGAGVRGVSAFPFFTDGFPAARPDMLDPSFAGSSVGEQAMRAAAYAGAGHWLFNQGYYTERGSVPAGGDPADPQFAFSIPYLHYLLFGHVIGVSPHPLFSHAAYRALGDTAGIVHPFWHYARSGILDDRRTSAIFDPEFYLSENPEARLDIGGGGYANALQHFLYKGIGTGLPFSPDFDADYYLDRYEDARDAVESGFSASPAHHFIFFGLRQGRQPNPYFDPDYYLLRNPFVRQELETFQVDGVLEHFLLFGRARGLRATPPSHSVPTDLNAAKVLFEKQARRAAARTMTDGLSFPPAGDDPVLSVVFPVHRQPDMTAQALRCASFAAAHCRSVKGDVEVIAVANGAGPETREILDRCKNLRVEWIDRALGYTEAAAIGAGLARGRYVLVANDDIRFDPDTFALFVDRLERSPDVGIVGGITILPDETVQEAGSYLLRDGSAVGFGRGEDPASNAFAGVHDVDYCTGSAIAFRKADYDRVGGFDLAYSPGYYEEADLSMRMRNDLGLRSVCDSAITVTHFEHASYGSGRPPTATAAKIRTNQAYFRTKHAVALATLRDHGDMDDRGRLLNRVLGRPRVLYIEDLIPDARNGSGFSRSREVIDALLARGIPCELFIVNPGPFVADFGNRAVTVHRGWLPGCSLGEVIDRYGHAYTHIIVARAHNLRRFTRELTRAKRTFGSILICDTEAVTATRYAAQHAMRGLAITTGAVDRLVRAEFDSHAPIDRWLTVNEVDAATLAAAGYRPVDVVGFSGGYTLPPSTAEGRSGLLSVGAVHSVESPNHDAMAWFLAAVWPLVLEQRPDERLTVAGAWTGSLAELVEHARNVDYVGVLSDDALVAAYRAARVAIAPTRFAAGIPTKVIDAVRAHVPIVLTPILATQVGMPCDAASGVAPGPPEFAALVLDLLDDDASWIRVRNAQSDAVAGTFSASAFGGQLDHFVELLGLLRGQDR